MRVNNLIASVLLVLLSVLFSCGSDEETPVDVIDPQPAATHALTPQEIAERALRSTVYLRFKNAQGDTMFGSGFVIREDGLIATTYHATADMKSNSTAQIVNSVLIHPIETIVVVDQAHDLALIKAPKISAPALPLGNSDTVRVGDAVYVTGNPEKYVGTFSAGFISAIRPGGTFVEDKVIQMTAAVSQGSSGSPVLDANGEVIGIASSIDTAGQLLNFAVPVNFLKALLDGL